MPKPVWNEQQIVEALTREFSWLRAASGEHDVLIPGGKTFTYKFLEDFDPLFGAFGGLTSILDDPSDFTPANEFDRIAFRRAFDLWSDVTNVTFREGGGDIEIGFGYSGTAAFVSSGFGFDSGIWVNNNRHMSNSNLFQGNHEIFQTTLMHEIGHAIGLSHPGHYNGTADFERDADYFQDTDQYSLMSYFQEWQNGSGINYNQPSDPSDPNTPMLHDILAIQSVYGANTDTRDGFNVYGFNATGEGMRPVFDFGQNTSPVVTIWDGGGFDVFNLSNFGGDQRIDLREGHYSDAVGMQSNVAIAFGTQIEEAIGGRGNDEIHGNELNNPLQGRDGQDIIFGHSGGDYIQGQGSIDTLVGGQGGDTLFGGQGNDILIGDDAVDGNVPAVDPNSGELNSDLTFTGPQQVSDDFDRYWGTFNTEPRSIADITGDGIADVVGFDRAPNWEFSRIHTAVGNEESAFDDSVVVDPDWIGWRIHNWYPRMTADIDGDGRDDIVAFGGHHVHTRISNGDGTFQPLTTGLINDLSRDHNWATQDTHPRQMAYLDDDDFADIVAIRDDGVWTSRGRGDGTFEAPRHVTSEFGRNWKDQQFTPRRVGDFDGDGLDDIAGFRDADVFITRGKGDLTFEDAEVWETSFVRPGTANGQFADNFHVNPRQIGDFNGDGKDDIAVLEGRHVHIALSNGVDGFGEMQTFDAPAVPDLGDDHGGEKFQVGDLNGDGRDDLFVFGAGGIWAQLSEAGASDTLTGGVGDDQLDGGAGVDIGRYSGAFSDYVVDAAEDGRVRVTDMRNGRPDGQDLVESVERLEFSDAILHVGTSERDEMHIGAVPGRTGVDHYIRGGGGQDRYIFEETSTGASYEFLDYAAGEKIVLPSGLEFVETDTGLLSAGQYSFSQEGDFYIIRWQGDGPNSIFIRGVNPFAHVEVAGDPVSTGGTVGKSTSALTAVDSARVQLNSAHFEDAELREGEWVTFASLMMDGQDAAPGTRTYEVRGMDDALSLRTPDGEVSATEGVTFQNPEEVELKAAADAGSAAVYVRVSDTAAQSTWQSLEVMTKGPGYVRALEGTGGNDIMNGGDGIDHMRGHGGDDIISGGFFDDRLLGDAGNDRLNGQIGDDSLDGGHGDDILDGGDGADRLQGGTGHDTLRGRDGDDVLGGHSGDDFMMGDDGDDIVDGGDGNDGVAGENGHDTVRGGNGDDRVWGGSGNDTLRGENGDDLLFGGADDDDLSGESGNDQVFGGNGNDTVDGGLGDGADYLIGGAGDDEVHGRSGNDTLGGSEGADRLFAGDGDDRADGGDGDDGVLGGHGQDTVRGGNGDDTVWGGGGDDLVRGENGDDKVYGGAGNDDLRGEAGSDTAYGGDGDDRVDGGLDDAIDHLFGGAGNDLVLGRGGDDQLNGNQGDDMVFGSDGDDRMNGDDGEDRIGGGSGDDQSWGGEGDDTLWGGKGNDVLSGDDGNDRLYSGAGNDTLKGGAGDDWMVGGIGDDVLYGQAGDDTVWGSNGHDRMEGGDGNDRLGGFDGDDFLEGGKGDDVLWGGGGADRFVFSRSDGHDRITDFTVGEDVIQFEQNVNFNKLTLTEDGANLLIEIRSDSILIEGGAAMGIGQDDFLFV